MKPWTMFWTLAVIWGSSFLLIKVAVEDLEPLHLVSIRIGLAAVCMGVYLRVTRRRWPSERSQQIALLFVGVMNTAVPFTLITWGEQNIDSGLATVLNATVPLFTLVFAHVALADERITSQKVLGLILGFLGVVLLASRSTDSSSANSMSGQLAVLAASGCYAVSVVVLRRYLRQVDPFTIAGYSLMVGAVTVIAIALAALPLPDVGSLGAKSLAAAVVLALLNTVLAYFLYYGLLGQWGATRSTLVTYAMPPIGVTLGALFLDETVDWRIVVGAALILAGIVVVNWSRNRSALRVSSASEVAR